VSVVGLVLSKFRTNNRQM